jgi:hypothetical protein
MPDDYVGHPDFQQHADADFAGVGTLFFPVHVLRANCDIGVLGGLERGWNVEKWRANDDLIAIVACDQRKELAEERLNLIGSLAHLPVGGDYFFSHGEFLSIFRGDRAPDLCNFSKAAV